MTGLLTAAAAATLLWSAAPAPTPATPRADGPAATAVATSPPRLVLVIAIDQLRSDLLTRYRDRFLPPRGDDGAPGGFRFLTEGGAWYPLAEHDVAHALTAPGHAALMSGAYPYRTGIILNRWYDDRAGARVYCVGDDRYHGVGTVPPTFVRGTAPTHLRATTLGDAFKLVGFPSRVVSIALKDRAAILMAGHRADVALWFDWGEIQWMSSTYYEPDARLPAWADALNTELARRRGQPVVFESTGGSGLSDGAPAGFRVEAPAGSYESATMPFGLEITTDAAVSAADSMKLGRGRGPDLLAVSYSPLDYLGHDVGHTRLEMEELVVHHDRQIARLLGHLERTLPAGLRDVTIVLTGDHGGPAHPDRLTALGLAQGKLSDGDLVVAVNAHLSERFGALRGADYVAYAAKLNFYLNRSAIAAGRHPVEAIEAAIVDYLRSVEGVAHAFSRTDFLARRLPPGLWGRQIEHSYHLGRSGDVVGLPWPYWVTGSDPVVHMTGYTYDRHVPLVLWGRHFRPGVYGQRAEVVDVAPTLSLLTGSAPPSMSEGRVLHEALARDVSP